MQCQTTYDLSTWADIPRLCTDPDYARSRHLRVKKQGELFVIRYDKEQLLTSRLDEGMGLFRSVVSDGENILAFSPPKAVEFPQNLVDVPIYEPDENGDFGVGDGVGLSGRVEEFVEGTMVNVFWNPGTGDWELSTRSCIGARNMFYEDSGKTFRYMFLEAMNNTTLEFADLEKELCYSFVLQHPDNRLVVPFATPHLVLVAVYRPTGSQVLRHYPVGWKKALRDMDKVQLDNTQDRVPVRTPRPFVSLDGPGGGHTFTQMKAHFDAGREGYQVMGVVIHFGDGKRAKIRNKNYEYVRRLRGNSTKMQFHYYSLRQAGKVGEFLWFYPEWATKFSEMREDLHSWTTSLRGNYMACFARKEGRVHDYPFTFRPHMRALHQIYRNTLRAEKKHVTHAIVRDYVNDLPPARLMFAINYEVNQRHTDENVVEIMHRLQGLSTQSLPSS